MSGEPPVAADDIYGLGALAYELLSGAPPFYPNFDVVRVRTEPAPTLRPAYPVPPRLEQLVMRMLAKRPAARPATMHDVASELNSVLHDTLIAPEDMLQSLRDAAHDYPGPAENTTLDALNVTQALPISDSDDDDNIDLPPVDLVQKPKQSAAPVPDNLSVGPYADGKRDDRDDLPLVDLKELADSAHAALPRIEDVFRAGSSRPRVRRTGVWLTAAVLAAIALGVFFWLPRLVEKPAPIVQATVNESAATAVDAAARAERAKSLAARQSELKEFARRIDVLDQRGAALWSGDGFARAKALAAEADAALERNDLDSVTTSVEEIGKAVAAIEAEVPAALEAQLAAGDRALASADAAVARQAYVAAARIDPDNARARDGLANLAKLLDAAPLLAQAEAAAESGDASTAERIYRQVLAKYPGNIAATSGVTQLQQKATNEAFSKAMGEGFAALTAGRTNVARAAFGRAQAIRPAAAEVAEALAQVDAAARGTADANVEALAARLVAEERWTEALALYEQALATDPTLEFAQRGKARTLPRADLSRRLQTVIERPERSRPPMCAPRLSGAGEGAFPCGTGAGDSLADFTARDVDARFRPTVTLALESDNATEVAIQRVGYFGASSAGTGVGARAIHDNRWRKVSRDVRREFTLAPGTDIPRRSSSGALSRSDGWLAALVQTLANAASEQPQIVRVGRRWQVFDGDVWIAADGQAHDGTAPGIVPLCVLRWENK